MFSMRAILRIFACVKQSSLMIDLTLFAYMEEMLKQVPTTFSRYMSEEIDWDSRMIGITGPRGVGKSTMLLQRIVRHRGEGLFLYVSADHI